MKLFITVDNFFRGLESLCELAVCEVFVELFYKSYGWCERGYESPGSFCRCSHQTKCLQRVGKLSVDPCGPSVCIVNTNDFEQLAMGEFCNRGLAGV